MSKPESHFDFTIHNAGNSCYIDSVLTALFYKKTFLDKLLDESDNELASFISTGILPIIRTGGEISAERIDIFRTLCHGKGWRASDKEALIAQQDASEFFEFLWEQLDGPLIQLKKSTITKFDTVDKSSSSGIPSMIIDGIPKGPIAPDIPDDKDDKDVKDKSSMFDEDSDDEDDKDDKDDKDKDDKKTSTDIEEKVPYISISCPMTGDARIDEMIAGWMYDNTGSGLKKMYLGHQVTTPFLHIYRITNIPLLLTIRVERFSYGYRDTANILPQIIIKPMQFEDGDVKDLQYKFHSAVCHQGETPTAGHYYSLMSYQKGKHYNWTIFNDLQDPSTFKFSMKNKVASHTLKQDIFMVFYMLDMS
jgi:hypothetical protein